MAQSEWIPHPDYAEPAPAPTPPQPSLTDRLVSLFTPGQKEDMSAKIQQEQNQNRGKQIASELAGTEWVPHPDFAEQPAPEQPKQEDADEEVPAMKSIQRHPEGPTNIERRRQFGYSGEAAAVRPMATAETVEKGLVSSVVLEAYRMWHGLRLAYLDSINDPETLRSLQNRGVIDAERVPAMIEESKQKIRSANEVQNETTPVFKTKTGEALYGVTQGLAQFAPEVAASVINPAAGVAAFGGGAATSAYGKYRERGGTPTEAAVGGGLEGAIMSGTSFLPLGFISKNFGQQGIQQFAAGMIQHGAAPMVAQSVATSIVDTAIANPNKTWGQWYEELPDNIKQAALGGMLFAGGMAGAHAGVKAATERLGNKPAPAEPAEPAPTTTSTEAIPAGKEQPSIPEEPKSPMDQATADAEIIKSGQVIPGADAQRVKNATLVALHGDNAAVRHAIEGEHTDLVDRMLNVSPTAERVSPEEITKKAEEAEPTAMSQAFAKAKITPKEEMPAEALKEFSEHREGPKSKEIDPDSAWADYNKKLEESTGLSHEKAVEAHHEANIDPVTGLYDDSELLPTLRRAQESGEKYHYVESDIFNMSGGNHALGGNEYMDAVLAKIGEEYKKAFKGNPVFKRAGGRFAAVVPEGFNVEAAKKRAADATLRIARENNLEDIPAPKSPGNKGIGLYSSNHPIESGAHPNDIIGNVQAEIKAAMPQEAENVHGRKLREAWLASSKGQARRVAGRVEAQNQDGRRQTRNGEGRGEKELSKLERANKKQIKNAGHFLDPEEQRNKEYDELAARHGYDAEQKKAFQPHTSRDKLTGFFTKRDLNPTIERARQLAKKDRTPSVLMVIDISNLSGMTDALGRPVADVLFRNMAEIAHERGAEDGTADTIPFRHGGDEISLVGVGMTREHAQLAMDRATADVQRYVKAAGIEDVPHPKYPGRADKAGSGIYVGIREINPHETVSQIRQHADESMELAKGEPKPRVEGKPMKLMGEEQAPEKEVAKEEKQKPKNRAEAIKQEKAEAKAKIEEASKAAAHSPENNKPLPTEAQHEAGNYAKGHVNINGLDIAIENPKGSVRVGTHEGKAWQVKMQNPYGYIKRSEGADGEHVDVYLGDHITKDQPVFVIDQIDPETGKFDEHKVVIGARGYAEAKDIYDAHFSDKSGPDRRGAISKMPLDEFKTWIKGDTTGPVKYKEPQPKEVKHEAKAEEATQAQPEQAGEPKTSVIRPAVESLIKQRRFAQEKGLGIRIDKAIVKAKEAMKTGAGDPAEFSRIAKPFKAGHPEVYKALMDIADSITPIKTEPKPAGTAPAEKAAQKKELVYQAQLRGLETHEKTAAELEKDIKAHDEEYGEPVLEQKKVDYETHGKNQEGQDVYSGKELRSGVTVEQQRLGRDAYREILSGYARRAGATLLGSRIARDFKQEGGATLIGQEAKTHQDLATIAQVLRDPRFETLRVFFTKDGKIVGHTGVTSRLPGMVKPFNQLEGETSGQAFDRHIEELSRQKEALGADGYWWLHNHPSGKADPSRADQSMTSDYERRLSGLNGHVVIDHDEYSVIDGSGKFELHDRKFDHPYDKEFHEVPHHLLSSTIRGPDDLVAIGKQLERKEGFFTLVGRDAQGNVSALAEFPESLLVKGGMKELRLAATFRRFASQTGSTEIFAIAKQNHVVALSRPFKQGLLRDVINEQGRSLHEFMTQSGEAFSERAKAIRVEQTTKPYGKSRLVKEGEEKPKETFVSRIKSAIGSVREGFADLKDAYTRVPEFTESQRIIGEYTGKIQEIDFNLSKMAHEINKELPRDRQEAITNYIQAGGDENVLRERAATAKPKYKKGYEDALTLTPEEKKRVELIQTYQDSYWKLANEAGILEGYVENYVRGQWERENDSGRKILSMVNSGMLNDHPREAMQKIFKNYFEGEQLGYKPTDKRIGYQFISGQRSIQQAIAARKALTDLMHSKEADGRPTVSVGGAGSMLEEGEEAKPYFVKPNVKGEEAKDYRLIDHPSLRKWKWVGQDSEGKPILMQGNMYIHPDAYGKLNAILGKSWVRQFTIPEKYPVIGGRRPGEAMLKAGAFIKSTMLIGPFHQFHLGEHAVFHGVNPVNTPEIDFNTRPLLREGVNHGLMLYNHNAMHEFSEGLASGGLIHRIPIAGDALQRYGEYLFQDYIPRLKAAMFEKAVERAEIYYRDDLASGKFTRDQLLENAAKQANAAFGELNYKYMARNPTYQDLLRVALLAPDFLEARLKFAGQALSPKGREQMTALIKAAVIMSLGAQTINLMFGDDHKVRLDRPFSVIIGGREYSPRSVIGDIHHFLTDPRDFWYNRVNPLWGRPLLELGTGRDKTGSKEDFTTGVENILKSWIPLPAQGFMPGKNSDLTVTQNIVNAILGSIGISSYETKSDAMKMASDFVFNNMPKAAMTDAQIAHRDAMHPIIVALRNNEPDRAQQLFKEGVEKKLLAAKDMATAYKIARTDPLVYKFKHLTYEQATQVMQVASPEEKQKLALPYLEKRLSNAKNHPVQ